MAVNAANFYKFVTCDNVTTPTLKDAENFDAEKFANTLREAMKGMGTDEDAILNVLGQSSLQQRQAIVATFKSSFGKDLLKELDSELSGNFNRICKSLCLPAIEFDCHELRRAMKGAGTDETALIEILCTRENAYKRELITAYNKLFQKDLEKDICSETSGGIKRLLVALLQCNRDDESEAVDRQKVEADVRNMHEGGEKKLGTDESVFNQILVNRSYSHLREVFALYEQTYDKNIGEIIQSEMSGDLKNGMLTVVKCALNKQGYFAEALHKSMKGMGTDDDTLLRIVITRCEVDMGEIKNQFLIAYGKTLAEFIKEDCSGDYKKILLLLIGDFS